MQSKALFYFIFVEKECGERKDFDRCWLPHKVQEISSTQFGPVARIFPGAQQVQEGRGAA